MIKVQISDAQGGALFQKGWFGKDRRAVNRIAQRVYIITDRPPCFGAGRNDQDLLGHKFEPFSARRAVFSPVLMKTAQMARTCFDRGQETG
jgi:hypothetical protein